MITAKSLDLKAATSFANGAILVDEFDRQVFDDLARNFIVWGRIVKFPAPGETTGGFDQTATQGARAAAIRNLAYSATSPTRVARTRRDIKAIVSDLEFGMFDRSVYAAQGRRFGELERKDVQDMANACLKQWTTQFYDGDANSDPNEFDGMKDILGAGTTVLATASIVKSIQSNIATMVNSATRDVRPTAIYTNAQVVYMVGQELLKVGDKLLYAPVMVGGSAVQIAQLATPIGFLPLIADPHNSVVAGTPEVYPTFVVSEDKLSYQYIAPLGTTGPEPRTFDLTQDTDLDIRYKTVMFGAIDLLQPTYHFKRLNVEYRSTVVDCTL